MDEQEAIKIASQFIADEKINHEGFIRAFFVPASAYDYVTPDVRDSWVVHFRAPVPTEGVRLLSGGDAIVVSVDVKTRTASLFSSL